jgi:DNA-binding cell septation regulator SpoVG
MGKLKKYNWTEDVRAVNNIKINAEQVVKVIRAVESSSNLIIKINIKT